MLAVPAGAGPLTVEPAAAGYVLEELEEEKLTGRNYPGGPRLAVGAHARLDLPADAREHRVQLKVRRALTAHGVGVGAEGEAASKSASAMSATSEAMPGQ